MITASTVNLINNGDFEQGDVGGTPEEWVSSNVVLVASPLVFSGEKAASLGQSNPADPAVLYQDVGVVPGRRYQLTFQVSSESWRSGLLSVEIRWLTFCGLDLGTGLRAIIQGTKHPRATNGLWTAHVLSSDFAPTEACMARVVFSFSPGASGNSPVLLDSVTLAQID